MDTKKIISLLGCALAYFAYSMVVVSPENSSLIERFAFSKAIKETLTQESGTYSIIISSMLVFVLAIALSIWINKRRTIKILLPFFIISTLIKWSIESFFVAAIMNIQVEIKYFAMVLFIIGIIMAYQSLRSNES